MKRARALILLCLTLAPGCSLVASGLDDYETDDCKAGEGADRERNLWLRLRGFNAIGDQRVVMRLVRVSDETIVGVAVVDGTPLEPEPFERKLLRMLPAGDDYRIDAYVDANRNSKPDAGDDGAPPERSWRVPRCPTGLFDFSFESTETETTILEPDFNPDDGREGAAAIGENFEYTLTDFARTHSSGFEFYELRLVDLGESGMDEKRVVGFFHLPRITEDLFTTPIEAVAVPGHQYDVDHFADADRNGDYTPSAGGTFFDHTWRDHYTADEDGISEGFGHVAQFDVIDDTFVEP